MVRVLALLECERLVVDVADAGEVVEAAEQAATVLHAHVLVVVLATHERRAVDRVLPGEARLDDTALEVLYALGDVYRLVVEHKRDEVVRGVGLIGAKVARFVYEDAQLGQFEKLPEDKCGGETVPAQGWTRASRPAQRLHLPPCAAGLAT